MRYLVIPAYEPDKKLLTLLKNLQTYQDFSIIVVNDGSSIDYEPIFKEASQYATILYHDQNRGKGRALKTAFSHILTLQDTKEHSVVITADADGQHKPKDIFKVCKACESTPEALITGERYFTGKVPLRSRFGNTITKYVFFLSTTLKLNDTQCGLRAFSTSLLPFLCSIQGERYEYEMNVLLESARRIPVKGVPIETVYIDGNSSSHFQPLHDAIKIYKEIFKFALSSILAFLIDYIGYAFLIFILPPLPTTTRLMIANILSRLCSATFNYSFNKKFVFQDEQSVLKTGGKYAMLACFILCLNTILLLILTQLGLHNLYLAKIVVELFLFIFSWFIQKQFIFFRQDSIPS